MTIRVFSQEIQGDDGPAELVRGRGLPTVESVHLQEDDKLSEQESGHQGGGQRPQGQLRKGSHGGAQRGG